MVPCTTSHSVSQDDHLEGHHLVGLMVRPEDDTLGFCGRGGASPRVSSSSLLLDAFLARLTGSFDVASFFTCTSGSNKSSNNLTGQHSNLSPTNTFILAPSARFCSIRPIAACATSRYLRSGVDTRIAPFRTAVTHTHTHTHTLDTDVRHWALAPLTTSTWIRHHQPVSHKHPFISLFISIDLLLGCADVLTMTDERDLIVSARYLPLAFILASPTSSTALYRINTDFGAIRRC